MSEEKFRPISPKGLEKMWVKAQAKRLAHADTILRLVDTHNGVEGKEIPERFAPRISLVHDDEAVLIGIKYDNGTMPAYQTDALGCSKVDAETGELVDCDGTKWYSEAYGGHIDNAVNLSDRSTTIWNDLCAACKHKVAFEIALKGWGEHARFSALVASWLEGRYAGFFETTFKTEMDNLWPALAKQRQREDKAVRQKDRQDAALKRKDAVEKARKAKALEAISFKNAVRKLLGMEIRVS